MKIFIKKQWTVEENSSLQLVLYAFEVHLIVNSYYKTKTGNFLASLYLKFMIMPAGNTILNLISRENLKPYVSDITQISLEHENRLKLFAISLLNHGMKTYFLFMKINE